MQPWSVVDDACTNGEIIIVDNKSGAVEIKGSSRSSIGQLI